MVMAAVQTDPQVPPTTTHNSLTVKHMVSTGGCIGLGAWDGELQQKKEERAAEGMKEGKAPAGEQGGLATEYR